MLNWLNFGVGDPLTLSMGHPISARVKQLNRKPRLAGMPLASVIVIGGLWGTAQAGSTDTPADGYVPMQVSFSALPSSEATSAARPIEAHEKLPKFTLTVTIDGDETVSIEVDNFSFAQGGGDIFFQNWNLS